MGWESVSLEVATQEIGGHCCFERIVQLADDAWVGVEIKSGEARRSLAQRTFDDFVSPEHSARVKLRDGRVIEITDTALQRVRYEDEEK